MFHNVGRSVRLLDTFARCSNISCVTGARLNAGYSSASSFCSSVSVIGAGAVVIMRSFFVSSQQTVVSSWMTAA